MNRKFFAALACVSLAVPAFLVCGGFGNPKVKDPIVRVGKTAIGKASFESFQKTARIYPLPLPAGFPGQRTPMTFMAEAEAIYQYSHAEDASKAKALSNRISESLDWAWKVRYFTSAPFFDLLHINLGFTDAELEARYKRAPEAFRVVGKTEDGRDTSFVPPFESVKRLVADSLFLEKYPPDDDFIAKRESESSLDHNDDAEINTHWLYSVRLNPADFYMRRFFFERTGEIYIDSVQQIYGDDKFIVSDDIDIIRSWVPPNRRNMRMKELIEWLYKWKIFAEESEKRGLTAAGGVKEMIHWASRIEYAVAYVEEEILPGVREEGAEPSQTDLSLAELFLYDQARRVEQLTAQMINSELEDIKKLRIGAAVDGAINKIRKSVGIEWLQDEFKDDKNADPGVLSARADSLRDAAAEHGDDEALAEAEKVYRTIAAEFSFSAEGRRAMNEVAKIMLDRFIAGGMRQDRLLLSAISYYRRSQVLETDMENICNGMFMVGFAYDEHLKNYPLAEVNYKWILRNAPNCTLAADAEFMVLHLGEPMTSIEEIQGRSLRQGRKIDFEEEQTPAS